jgi:hypothetical protein
MGPNPFQYLPLWARVAVEWLDGRSELRSQDKLDAVLDHSAQFYGVTVHDAVREKVREICRRRFMGSYTEPAVSEPFPPGTLRLIRLAREGALSAGDRVATLRLGECEVTRVHTRHSIEVRDPSTGRHYLISGLDFGPDARIEDRAARPGAA